MAEVNNPEAYLERGHLYRIRSRNLPYGVYDGNGGFIGVREKFGDLYLFTEYGRWLGASRFGTVSPLEDLGPIPEGIKPELSYARGGNRPLFDWLCTAEKLHGRGEGYGQRPGDEQQPPRLGRKRLEEGNVIRQVRHQQ